MTDRPRCYNRPKFADLIHHGKGQDGQPTRTVIPHRMSQFCGSFRDVQKFDGTNPVPRPIFEGWACAGCVWHPNARKAMPKPKRRRHPNSAIYIAPPSEGRVAERKALAIATGLRV